jgi:type IV pilus assembly protein PilB
MTNITTEPLHIAPEILQVIRPVQAWHYKVVAIERNEKGIVFWMDESMDLQSTKEDLELHTGEIITIQPQSSELIQRLLGRFYRRTENERQSISFQSHEAEHFIESLIGQAREFGSSDIHIEIYDDKARVRIRIDGLLVERYKLEKSQYPALINRIKILAKLDIAEKRLPQDGRMAFVHEGSKFDIRVSTLPTLYGEKVVLRLLNKDASQIDISKLGMRSEDLFHYMEGIRKPHGIVLISGPTGSGKTTTLYASLKILNEEKRNILTVEDPVEYTLGGINQVQLKESIGLTFASALRSFLRQDPDVIMLGEIRDAETAEMAVRAALTGHLVLSTIHTNSAWGTISRLIDMKIEPFLVASTLNLSVAQRLVRRLCSHCKKESELLSNDIPLAFRNDKRIPEKHFLPVGCERCHFTGYSGRIAIYEMVPVNMELQNLIRENVAEPVEYYRKKNIQRLSDNALNLYLEGTTSLEEVLTILSHT